MRRALGAAPLVALWAVPLMAGMAASLGAAWSAQGWQSLLNHPQLWPALGLSLFTGTASAALALLCVLIMSAGLCQNAVWRRLQGFLGIGLAIPHLAFAIGFGFLIMPSGVLARILVGGDDPPRWVTTQDPYGLALIAVLTFKEIPFLLAMVWSALSRGDTAASLRGQWRAGRSLGHGPGSLWLRIIQPQLLPRLLWPVVIVWVYGATVIDMALVIGPTQPPTLAVVLWHDLNDADSAMNARGSAGAALLTMVLAALALGAWTACRFAAPLLRGFLAAGPSLMKAPRRAAAVASGAVGITYGAVAGLLIIMSLAARWAYPALVPEQLGVTAWAIVGGNAAPVWLSLGLALATSAVALAAVVLWFETQRPQADRWLLGLALLALGLPQILIVAGQYRLFLPLDLAGSLIGLFAAHLTPVLAYVAIVLAGPYRGFDQRHAAVARSLHAGPWRLWWRVKAPLLRGPLLTAAAIGFGVSMVQYLPAQLVAAGRHATLPVEAVTLAAGGNRPLTAAFALALALPPLLAFALAGAFGRPRWH